MEFDPISRELPPSRHAIESDSEESEDETERQIVNSEKSKKVNEKKFKVPTFTLKSTGVHEGSITSKPLILFMGSIGESYIRSNNQWNESLAFISENDGEQQGSFSLSQSGSSIGLLRPDSALTSDQANLAYISASILSSLRPSSITIIDEYHPALYLYEKDSNNSHYDVEPIRILHSSQPSPLIENGSRGTAVVQSFDAPNYVTGLGAALLTESISNKIPASLVLVPQQRSINPHLEVLQRVPNASSSIFERPEILESELSNKLSSLLGLAILPQPVKASPAKLLDGFLHQRRSEQRKRQQNEISAMYM